jgi:hypothetical protein
MHKRSILLLGMLLGSLGSAAAQTSAPRIVLAQVHVAPLITMPPTASTPLPAASFLLSQAPGKSTARFSFPFAGAYGRDYGLERLSPTDEVKTFILTQSSLPLVQLCGGRLQLDAFQSTLHIQNVQLGPRSVHLSGLSLSFHFGRDVWTGHPAQPWRRLTRIVGAILN